MSSFIHLSKKGVCIVHCALCIVHCALCFVHCALSFVLGAWCLCVLTIFSLAFVEYDPNTDEPEPAQGGPLRLSVHPSRPLP